MSTHEKRTFVRSNRRFRFPTFYPMFATFSPRTRVLYKLTKPTHTTRNILRLVYLKYIDIAFIPIYDTNLVLGPQDSYRHFKITAISAVFGSAQKPEAKIFPSLLLPTPHRRVTLARVRVPCRPPPVAVPSASASPPNHTRCITCRVASGLRPTRCALPSTQIVPRAFLACRLFSPPQHNVKVAWPIASDLAFHAPGLCRSSLCRGQSISQSLVMDPPRVGHDAQSPSAVSLSAHALVPSSSLVSASVKFSDLVNA